MSLSSERIYSGSKAEEAMSEARAEPALSHRTLFQMADLELVIGPPLCRDDPCVAPPVGRISPQIPPKKTFHGSICRPIVHKKAPHGSISY